jgi:butyryl-CoA dehydrogenase
MLVDMEHEGDETLRRESELLLDILTPIVKAWGSEYALKANDLAIQVLGGYGFTREYPVEQCYRDNRINPIHEGTNGIQAHRPARAQGDDAKRRALKLLLQRIGATCAEAAAVPGPAGAVGAQLLEGVKLVERCTPGGGGTHGQRRGSLALANASHYMTLLGTSPSAGSGCSRHWWQAVRCRRRPGDDDAFYRGKLAGLPVLLRERAAADRTGGATGGRRDASAFEMADAWF